ncbi:MAG: tetratricopeptide repeat protein [Prevotella sp.]|nr:tetratricopeptide repeat protein [Prevotella sp.]
MISSKNTFQAIKDLLRQQCLQEAIVQLKKHIDESPQFSIDAEFEELISNYRLMLEYMQQGFKDPRRAEIYQNLLQEMYRITANYEIKQKILSSKIYGEAAAKTTFNAIQPTEIKNKLESFVSDSVLMELNIGKKMQEKQKFIYQEHYDYMNKLFFHILTSKQWQAGEVELFEQILLSPTIDKNDAALIISAISISATNVLDINKLKVLINVYMQSKEPQLQQRSLIGLAMALNEDCAIFPELKEMLIQICQNEHIAKEFKDLQLQIFYCLNAEDDTRIITDEIMPDIMQNNQFDITTMGIREQDEDSLEDILHPERAEEEMERLEESFKKIQNMHKNGADIYFGGFSQMKRFAFFYTMPNWFRPFTAQHPEVAQAISKLEEIGISANGMLNQGLFCDNDKYSLVLAIGSVIDKLPDSMKETMGRIELAPATFSDEEKSSISYIRRMYLQDLYRFFKLFPQVDELKNPFEKNNGVVNSFFFSNKLLAQTNLKKEAPAVANYLVKTSKINELDALLNAYGDENDPQMLIFHATLNMQIEEYGQAVKFFRKMLEADSENTYALKGIARAYFALQDYEQSSIFFKTLTTIKPDNISFMLNYCLSRINQQQAEETLETLYRLDFEHPENLSVQRVLAWALLCSGKIEQATATYHKILQTSKFNREDNLYMGYCLWISGKIKEAACQFRQYDPSGLRLLGEFEKDRVLLQQHGINKTDFHLMNAISKQK